jgi:hypothetical protein
VTDFFSQIKGGFSVHVEEDGFTGVRFCLARFGEDPDKVLAQFWRENSGGGDFELVPLAPRLELCSQRSLASALQSVTIAPGSRTEQQWQAVANQLGVAWPTRLQPKKPKAA